MSDDNNFPKIINGACDGMGCSGFCWCTSHTEMQEEFQREFNKPWKEQWDENPDIDCQRWERIWRIGTRNATEYFETELANQKKFYRLMMDNRHEEYRQLRIQVHQLKQKLKKLEK